MEELVKFFNFIKDSKYKILFFIFIILVFIIIVKPLDYEYNDGIKKKEFVYIYFETIEDKKYKYQDLKLLNDICEREKKDKLVFKCYKPKGNLIDLNLEYGEYSGKINIYEDKFDYHINLDKKDYFIKEALLTLNNNNFNGKVLVVDKEKNAPKYTDTKNKFDLKIYESTFNATIKNAEILFSKPWEEFSKIYYLNNKFMIDFEIENEKFHSYKPYFLTKELNIEDLFSLGQNNKDFDLNKLLKIQNNRLIIFNDSDKLPNINLFRINNSEKVNGYMKFTINNINKENKFNLFMNGKHIFKYEYPFFKFDIREVNNDNLSNRKIIDGKSFFQDFIAPNEKEVKIVNNKINNMNFLIEKTNDNCKISVNVNKYKKVTKEFFCEEDKISNDIILTQLNIENFKCLNKNCVLFEISDLETGLDYTNSPTRDYKY